MFVRFCPKFDKSEVINKYGLRYSQFCCSEFLELSLITQILYFEWVDLFSGWLTSKNSNLSNYATYEDQKKLEALLQELITTHSLLTWCTLSIFFSKLQHIASKISLQCFRDEFYQCQEETWKNKSIKKCRKLRIFFFLDHRGVHRNKKSLYSLMNDH